MIIVSQRTQGLIGVLAVVTAGTLSCSSTTAPQSPAPTHVMIANISQVAGEFPQGWAVQNNPRETVDQDAVNRDQNVGFGLAVRPPQCAARLRSTPKGVVGQVIESLAARTHGIMIGVAATEAPGAVPMAAADGLDCSYATFGQPGVVNGTITPAPAVAVDGVKVDAVHVVTDYDDKSGRTVDQYIYVGIVDDRHAVAVSATAGPASENLAKIDVGLVQKIFVKAVASVRS